jgi:hypothetical protein
MIKSRETFLNPAYECDFNLQCSSCGGGTLKVKNGSLSKRQTNNAAEFNKITQEVAVDNSSLFCLLLECKNCNEVFCVAGTVSLKGYHGDCGFEECLDRYYEYCEQGLDDLYEHYHDYYNIKYISPQINIFTIPDQVTDNIKNFLTKSFALFWGDEEASANKIRTVLELLMDHFGIRKTDINKKGKEYSLSLNSRLNLFRSQKNFGHLSEKLSSIKFLGNAGSHIRSVTKEDLLDAYEILEYVLEECFQRQERVESVVKKAKNLIIKYKT